MSHDSRKRDATRQETDTLALQLDALAAYIRDPAHAAPPPGIEERRLRVYRELFFNNIVGMLAGNFPVLRSIHGHDGWQTLVRDFYRDHASSTPLFTELPREFLRYLEGRNDSSDPAWQCELAHYEWVELALQICESSADDIAHDPAGDLLTGRPVLSPLAWPLAYAWPVNRIGPDFLPNVLPDLPTLLLLRRETDGTVTFHEVSALTYRLLQRLDELPDLTGADQLRGLAAEAGVGDDDGFLGNGHAMLLQLLREGSLLGTRVAG